MNLAWQVPPNCKVSPGSWAPGDGLVSLPSEHPLGEAGLCLALRPPVNNCHTRLVATPSGLLSASPGAQTRFLDNHWAVRFTRARDHIHRKQGAWNSAWPWVQDGAGVACDLALTGRTLAPSSLDTPWTLNPPKVKQGACGVLLLLRNTY